MTQQGLQAAKAAAELQEDAALQLASDMDRDLTMLERGPSAAGTSAEGRSSEQDDMEITEQELLVGLAEVRFACDMYPPVR